MRKQPFTFEEFKTIYSQVPRICVEIVIATPQGILLTYRTKNGYENQWHLPGGTVFYREKLKEALKRLAKEELSVEIKVGEFLGYIEYFSEVKERGFGYTISMAFLCHPKDLNLKLDNQAEKVDYFKEIPENTLIEQKHFLNGLIQSGELKFK